MKQFVFVLVLFFCLTGFVFALTREEKADKCERIISSYLGITPTGIFKFQADYFHSIDATTFTLQKKNQMKTRFVDYMSSYSFQGALVALPNDDFQLINTITKNYAIELRNNRIAEATKENDSLTSGL